ncbi:helix-turn-helix transcriptional regulator [Paenibacillus tarimensis]|uniref:helix-turn-helix transcriptional regulator n=1 Tax=Paenibacillus tarimensis TaxID=416012 RepID=UPI001F18BB25|nr:WYL domain-containing protein [Paenibacillus tarimensis]MCF2943304.1 WYL domain-containing protein [Paenibacillus tarimensis]
MNERRLAILRIIDARKKFTARELAERFDVSVRTIQRDLDALQSMGVPLYTQMGPHGGYRVLSNRILPPLQLTEQEALGLFLMLQYLERVPDFPYGTVRAHLAEQYYGALPDDVRDTIDRLRRHVLFRHNPQQHTPAPLAELALGAAAAKQDILFHYHTADGVKEVHAFPLGIYFERGCWYMPAKRADKDRVQLYRVDRMEQLVPGSCRDETLPDLVQWMNMEDHREGVKVELHFTARGARLAENDELFAADEKMVWIGRVPAGELPYTARRLLAYGAEVKVAGPPELQRMVIEELEKNLNQY